jgi:cytosine/adenosine deaminase-related metal-dependent hydrolase
MTPRIIRADAILPGEERPLRDGAVVLDASDTILDAGRAEDILARHAGAPIEHVRGVLLPGLVNAHAHVELSGLRGKVAGGSGFVPWVDRMMGIRASEQPEEDSAAIEEGAAELEAFGTVAIGDVTNTLSAVHALARHGIGGIVFHEIARLDPARAFTRLAEMKAEYDAAAATWPTADLAYAPAPHTVYTVHPDAIRAVLASSRVRGVRTTVHLAEHPAERTFLLEGRGPFVDFARKMGFAIDGFPVPRRSPVDVAADLGLLSPDVLLVHLTDIRARELEAVVASGAPVVLCPRSNLFIEVRLPPLIEMLNAGMVPALGTDSLASNLSLDVLAEAKALGERFPSVPKGVLTDMATAAGARALGRQDLGRLAKGLRPGVLSVEGELAQSEDPCAWVLRQPATCRRWVARRGGTSKEIPS